MGGRRTAPTVSELTLITLALPRVGPGAQTASAGHSATSGLVISYEVDSANVDELVLFGTKPASTISTERSTTGPLTQPGATQPSPLFSVRGSLFLILFGGLGFGQCGLRRLVAIKWQRERLFICACVIK